MNKDVVVSVVIPVLNEEKYIEKCIESLSNQTYPISKMEWIIVDGNSKDLTCDIISKYSNDYPIKLLKNMTSKTPTSLNIGIKESAGIYIIRMDAHAAYPPDYIEKCVYYLENTDAINVGGFVDTKAEGFVGNAISQILSSKFGVGGSSFRVDAEEGYVDTVPFGAFRKSIFDEIGYFNEKLLRSEDNDINARIRDSGGKILLKKDIRSTYYCRDTVAGLLRMALQNGNALFWTVRENKNAMSIRHFVPLLFVLSLLVLSGLYWILPMRIVLFTEIILYMLLDLYFCLRDNLKYSIIKIWLYPAFHICYGIGSILGLLLIKLY